MSTEFPDLPELPEALSAQELFDTVADHLLTQGSMSKSASGACAYRGTGDTKCAIGCLIPDSEYKTYMEGIDVKRLVSNLYMYALIGPQLMLASELQLLHDGIRPANWPDGLLEIAKMRDLNTDVVYAFKEIENEY